MDKISSQELLAATLAWVYGELLRSATTPTGMYYQYFTLPNGSLNFSAIQEFSEDLHGKVWRHLVQNRVIDASYSDYAANLSLTAKRIFGTHLANSEYDITVIAAATGLSVPSIRQQLEFTPVIGSLHVGQFIANHMKGGVNG